MGKILQFHATADSGSGGYRSGRSSERDTPEMRSTAKTLSGGTSSHCETAWIEMPKGPAIPAKPPAALIARSSPILPSDMGRISSIASPRSQVSLHCEAKAFLYTVEMTLGKRIKVARTRLPLSQRQLGKIFGITDKAVSSWERGETSPELERLPVLRRALRVTFAWLLAGDGDPPGPDDYEVRMDDLATEKFARLGEPTKRRQA